MSIFDKFKKKIGKPVSSKKDDSERNKFSSVGSSSGAAAQPVAKASTSGKPAKAGVHGLGEMNRVIAGPVLTEKSSGMRTSNQYVFEVLPGANKSQIKKAFAVYYGVVPIKINSIKLPGKSVRFGKSQGKTKSRRKMIVKLPKGKSIEL